MTKQSIQPAIYIVTNRKNGALYTGVTSALIKRVYQHKQGEIDGFAKKYHCNILVYYELYQTMELAISREKQIKAGSRKQKYKLIESLNPEWKDLYSDLIL